MKCLTAKLKEKFQKNCSQHLLGTLAKYTYYGKKSSLQALGPYIIELESELTIS